MAVIGQLICAVAIFGVLSHPLQDAPHEDPIQEKILSNGMVIMRRRMSHAEAMNRCEMRNLRLAFLKEIDDAKALVAAIKTASKVWTNEADEKNTEFGMSRRYWIGLTDIGTEGEWTWVQEGTVLGFGGMWAYGQPGHLEPTATNHSEHCVSLWNQNFDDAATSGHLFNDENCMNRHYFICDKRNSSD